MTQPVNEEIRTKDTHEPVCTPENYHNLYMSTDEMALKDGGEQTEAKQALPSLRCVLFSCWEGDAAL